MQRWIRRSLLALLVTFAIGMPTMSQSMVSGTPIDQPQPNQHIADPGGGGGGACGNGASTDGDNGNRCCRTCR